MKKYDDYWEKAQKEILVDPKAFLNNLIHYERDKIGAELIKKVDKYIKMPEFTPENIGKSS